MDEERRNSAQKRRKSDEHELSAQEARSLVEDLRIHQVELEMQNQELQRAQQEIEESRTKLADLYDYAPVAYFSLNPNGKIVGLNLTAIEKLEYPRGLLEGGFLRDFMDRDSINEFDLYLDSIANDLGARPRDLVFVKRGGEKFWGRLECTRFHPLKVGGETIFLCSLIDVTERKNAEQSLRQSEEKYRLLIENVQSVIVRSDTEGRVTFINKYGKELFGYSEEELWLKGLIGTIVPEKLLPKGGFESVMKRIKKHPERYKRQEMTTVLRNGSEATISWTITVLRDGGNQTEGFLAIGHDITERVRLENELRQAQKMEAIGTLAGGIAHDFNNILAAIVGFTEMAIEDIGDNPVQRKLDNVLKSAVRARNLVKQVLAFSRKTNHDRHPISFSEIVRETMELLSASIPSTINTIINLPDKDDTITADPVEIQQVLINLATNAVYAMRDGGTLEISITVLKEDPNSAGILTEGDHLQLSVRDTGTGMTPEVQRRGFEPFFTTRAIGEGTGMGLATVYGIVKDLHGDISVESELGKGSKFTVILPKTKSPDTHNQSEGEKQTSGGGETILFIDDEEMLTEWGQTTLERYGFRVETASNAPAALDTFSKDPSRFDLIITDQAMPGMAGAELSKKLLQIRPDIPIILCTGHSGTVSPETAKDIGIREFLMKPLTRSELSSAVQRVLGETNRQ